MQGWVFLVGVASFFSFQTSLWAGDLDVLFEAGLKKEKLQSLSETFKKFPSFQSVSEGKRHEVQSNLATYLKASLPKATDTPDWVVQDRNRLFFHRIKWSTEAGAHTLILEKVFRFSTKKPVPLHSLIKPIEFRDQILVTELAFKDQDRRCLLFFRAKSAEAFLSITGRKVYLSADGAITVDDLEEYRVFDLKLYSQPKVEEEEKSPVLIKARALFAEMEELEDALFLTSDQEQLKTVFKAHDWAKTLLVSAQELITEEAYLKAMLSLQQSYVKAIEKSQAITEKALKPHEAILAKIEREYKEVVQVLAAKEKQIRASTAYWFESSREKDLKKLEFAKDAVWKEYLDKKSIAAFNSHGWRESLKSRPAENAYIKEQAEKIEGLQERFDQKKKAFEYDQNRLEDVLKTMKSWVK